LRWIPETARSRSPLEDDEMGELGALIFELTHGRRGAFQAAALL
jgi:hypothetical protein